MYRHIIHIHISAFSIAVERAVHPELRDRPVAVVPPRSERSVILCASAEAMKEGVFKGMPLSKAVKSCPGLEVINPNPWLTEKAGQSLAGVAGNYTPLWEPARPGHIYMDVTGTERLWGRAKDTALRVTREIKKRISLPAAVGVAGNKMVSSIASRIMPHEGILDVDHGREAPFMAPLKVGMVPGIGPFRRKILLEELNIVQVRELARLDLGNLRLIFGRQAFVIHQRAVGIDPTPVCPSSAEPSVKEEIYLAEDENDDQKILGVLYKMVSRCAFRLRKRSVFPKKAGLLIRYSDHMEARRQSKLPRPSFWDFDLYPHVEALYFKACDRRVRIRFIRIWFRDLFREPGQLSLFNS
ncbi:DNA polymerase IV, partial [Thermodesulfobacteriota bacterium]